MKILIADDHPLVRDALTRTALRADPLMQVVEAGTYDEVETSIRFDAPGVALIDLNMPGMDGITGLRRLRARYPSLVMVVASGQDDPATIRAVLDLGVSGFLPKSEAPEVLLQALRLVLSGGVYLPRLALGDLSDAHRPAPLPDAGLLTPRQRDVLRLLMLGQPNKVIARELALTEGTVKIHIAAILRALQARNRTEAVVIARTLGVVV